MSTYRLHCVYCCSVSTCEISELLCDASHSAALLATLAVESFQCSDELLSVCVLSFAVVCTAGYYSLPFDATAGMNSYLQRYIINGLPIPAGKTTIRVTLETSAFNMKWLAFVPTGSAAPTADMLVDIATDDNGDPLLGKKALSNVPFSLSEAVVAASDIKGLWYDGSMDAWAASNAASAVLSLYAENPTTCQVLYILLHCSALCTPLSSAALQLCHTHVRRVILQQRSLNSVCQHMRLSSHTLILLSLLLLLLLLLAFVTVSQVTYSLLSNNNKKPGPPVTVTLLRGRMSCASGPAANNYANEGMLKLQALAPAKWFTTYRASPIALGAANVQDLTLCFPQASGIWLGKICIGEACA
jgi:hypothetical protein